MRLAVLVMVLAGCGFSADYGGTGYRCSDGVCPAGQTCASGLCVAEAAPPDAPFAPVDAPPSPPPDASPPDASPPDAPPAFSPPWWDAMYPYRNRATITNMATSELPAGFQVRWLVNINGDLPVSVSDTDTLRVARWDGAAWTELNRVVDDNSATHETIWVRLVEPIPAGATDDSYFIYYGGDPATVGSAPSSWSAMWELYDGFNSATLSTTNWSVNPAGATITIASGWATLDYGESIRSNATLGMDEAVDFEIEAVDTSTRWWGGLQVAGTFADNQPWALWITRSENPGNVWPEIQADAAGITAPALGPTEPLVPAEEHCYTVIRQASRIVWEYDAIETHTQTVPTSWTEPMELRFTNQASGDIMIGFARSRQYIRPFPVGALLEVEMLP